MSLGLAISLRSVLLILAAAIAPQQADTKTRVNIIQIDRPDCSPGEMVQLTVEGIETDRSNDPAANEKLKNDLAVVVSQEGGNIEARIDSVYSSVLPEGYRPGKMPSALDNRGPLKEVQAVTFVVPAGLREGDAKINLSCKGGPAASIGIRVHLRPDKPFVASYFMTSIGGDKPSKMPANALQRAKEIHLYLRPLVDPKDPGSAIICSFEQGNSVRESMAIVSYWEGGWKDTTPRVWVSPQYFVTVMVPADLALGPAELSVRVKANGQLSDPATTKIMVIDPAAAVAEGMASASAPKIIAMNPSKAGIGQRIIVLVAPIESLNPNPQSARVLIEQGGRQEELKIEMNGAATGLMTNAAPLVARLGADITGDAQIRVLNPALGSEDGLSNAVDIHIEPEPLAPELTGAGDPTPTEMQVLLALAASAEKAGKEFKEYDPKSRYMVIRGQQMGDPSSTIVLLEQNGNAITLSPEDFSLEMSGYMIVRVPPGIGAGVVKVTVTNKGGGKLSAPASVTAELKQLSD